MALTADSVEEVGPEDEQNELHKVPKGIQKQTLRSSLLTET
jgi:hypothetical protein